MLIGALSLVMQVWLGISRKASRRSTHTGRSMSGIRNTRPGPLRPIDRPKRKTTRRWYSRTTFTASGITMSATIATTIGQKSSPNKEPSMGTPPRDTKRRLRIISCGSSSIKDREGRGRWGMESRVVVGVDIGGTKTLSAVVDAQGRVLARRRIETPQRGPQDFVQVLARELSTLLGLAGLQKEDLLGLGVGAPGPLDPETGVVFEPPNLA